MATFRSVFISGRDQCYFDCNWEVFNALFFFVKFPTKFYHCIYMCCMNVWKIWILVFLSLSCSQQCSDSQQLKVASSDCLIFLSQFLGKMIMRGRVESYNPTWVVWPFLVLCPLTSNNLSNTTILVWGCATAVFKVMLATSIMVAFCLPWLWKLGRRGRKSSQ